MHDVLQHVHAPGSGNVTEHTISWSAPFETHSPLQSAKAPPWLRKPSCQGRHTYSLALQFNNA